MSDPMLSTRVFLRAIIEQGGANEHQWLVACARSCDEELERMGARLKKSPAPLPVCSTYVLCGCDALSKASDHCICGAPKDAHTTGTS